MIMAKLTVPIRRRLGHVNAQTVLRYADQRDTTADAEIRSWRRRKITRRAERLISPGRRGTLLCPAPLRTVQATRHRTRLKQAPLGGLGYCCSRVAV